MSKIDRDCVACKGAGKSSEGAVCSWVCFCSCHKPPMTEPMLPGQQEALDFVDELHGRMNYGDYTRLHDLVSSISGIPSASLAPVVEALEKLKHGHTQVDDCWYSCPKSTEGCCDDAVNDKGECTCGADEHNASVDKLAATLRDLMGEGKPVSNE